VHHSANNHTHWYKLEIAYDGTDYHGWQQQESVSTIAQTLQDCFLEVFKKKIVIVGASRTDAGVHAAGQVAYFGTDFDIEPTALRNAWNNSLPLSIHLTSMEKINGQFHPQRGIAQKTYYYHFFTKRPLPFEGRYGWFYHKPIDLEKLRSCLAVFVGTHDFRSFCTQDADDKRSTIKTIDVIDIEYLSNYDAFRIIVKGHSFLHYMIRRIVGACLHVASSPTLTVKDLNEALEKKDPQQSLPKAPAHGLMLWQIKYHPENLPL
jgi:tRNA pseudouridine38-40 synthase